MIRTTYRGRPIKVLAARGKPGHVNLVINGRTINHAWQGDDAQALDWFRQIIDMIEDKGGAGIVAGFLPGQYTSPHWYEPGTIDINPAGHATQPGGICMCSQCVIDDPCGSKARFPALHPDACRYCHQTPDGHRNDFGLMNTHFYKEPTEQQRAGRQAAIDAYNTPDDEPDDEKTCDASYPGKPRGYLSPPRCLYFEDHRDASDLNFHADARGFWWKRETTA